MADLTQEGLGIFEETLDSLRDGFALALSENINQMAVFDRPTVSLCPMDTVLSDTGTVLQTTFGFSSLSSDQSVLVFSQQESLILADLAGGGTGMTPPVLLLDEHLNTLANAMQGTLVGFGAAIGNSLNVTLVPEVTSTTLEMLTLPPCFASVTHAVMVEYPVQVPDIMDSMLRLYFTSEMARSLAPAITSAENAAKAAAQAGEDTRSMSPSHSGGSGSAPAFDPFGASAENLPRGIDIILDIPLQVSVELGRKEMLIKDVLELTTGSIVELERVAGEPVDLLVNGRLVARGEVVVIDDNFGLRLTEIVSPEERLNSLARK